MILLIAGDTHTGKTLLAQRLLEKYRCPYLSMDHLKMGLLRSGRSSLPVDGDDAAWTAELWPIVREMVRTCIENGQHLIVEGCYIPFGWERGFAEEQVRQIRYVYLIFSEKYIANHFRDIRRFEHVVERRKPADLRFEALVRSNARNLAECRARNYRYILIDDAYRVDPDGL